MRDFMWKLYYYYYYFCFSYFLFNLFLFFIFWVLASGFFIGKKLLQLWCDVRNFIKLEWSWGYTKLEDAGSKLKRDSKSIFSSILLPHSIVKIWHWQLVFALLQIWRCCTKSWSPLFKVDKILFKYVYLRKVYNG